MKSSDSTAVRFSPSSLKLFEDCPRCFWLKQVVGLERPRGIMASITKGIDRVMKAAANTHVDAGTASQYLALLPGDPQPFQDRARLIAFQNWRKFQAPVQCGLYPVIFSGELDDLIYYPSAGMYEPWDYKSNGQEREWEAYTKTYNQTQADMYDVILRQGCGFTTTGYAAFTYTWPVKVDDHVIHFAHATVRVPTMPDRVMSVAEKAAECLHLADAPEANGSCEYCHYADQHIERTRANETAPHA